MHFSPLLHMEKGLGDEVHSTVLTCGGLDYRHLSRWLLTQMPGSTEVSYSTFITLNMPGFAWFAASIESAEPRTTSRAASFR